MSTAPKSQILKMTDLAAYQEGSVVSRQITKAEAGNVTLFAFDSGTGTQRTHRPLRCARSCPGRGGGSPYHGRSLPASLG